jgi:hypothetical protein
MAAIALTRQGVESSEAMSVTVSIFSSFFYCLKVITTQLANSS